ncbi:hypothetical protein FF1_009864 [Malus domestica]
MGSARELFFELLQVGLSPNVAVYSSMISGFRSLNNVEAALDWHNRMIREGIPCDLKAYTTLIDGFLREGELQSATDLYSEMLQKGIVPDKRTYTVLINALRNKGQLENARKNFEDMNSRGMTPSVHSYNTLVAGNFKEGHLQEAFRLHDEMLDKGLVPHDDTYDTLVTGKFQGTNASCFRCGVSSEALAHAVRFGQVGNDSCYCCSSQRCWGAAMDLLNQLRHVLSGEELCRFPFISWYLWSERNNVLHYQTPRDLALLLHSVMAIGVWLFS